MPLYPSSPRADDFGGGSSINGGPGGRHIGAAATLEARERGWNPYFVHANALSPPRGACSPEGRGRHASPRGRAAHDSEDDGAAAALFLSAGEDASAESGRSLALLPGADSSASDAWGHYATGGATGATALTTAAGGFDFSKYLASVNPQLAYTISDILKGRSAAAPPGGAPQQSGDPAGGAMTALSPRPSSAPRAAATDDAHGAGPQDATAVADKMATSLDTSRSEASVSPAGAPQLRSSSGIVVQQPEGASNPAPVAAPEVGPPADPRAVGVDAPAAATGTADAQQAQRDSHRAVTPTNVLFGGSAQTKAADASPRGGDGTLHAKRRAGRDDDADCTAPGSVSGGSRLSSARSPRSVPSVGVPLRRRNPKQKESAPQGSSNSSGAGLASHSAAAAALRLPAVLQKSPYLRPPFQTATARAAAGAAAAAAAAVTAAEQATSTRAVSGEVGAAHGRSAR